MLRQEKELQSAGAPPDVYASSDKHSGGVLSDTVRTPGRGAWFYPMSFPVCSLGEKMARRKGEVYTSRADG